MHYANHLAGFKQEMEPLQRITYKEDQEELQLKEEEQGKDEERMEEELEILGTIGFKNSKEPYKKFPEAIL